MNIMNYKLSVFLIFVFSIVLVSCDDYQGTVFNGDNTNNQSLIGFETGQLNLSVPINSEGQIEVTVNVSTISDTDRNIGLSVVEPEEDAENIAFPETYDLPSSVTIPAGEYQGTFVIEGFDLGLVEPEPRTFEIALSSSDDNDVFSIQNATVSVFEVCPIPEDYLVGTYVIEDSNGNLPTGAEVDISVGDTPTERVFVTTFLPGSAVAADVDVVLGLNCNKFNLAEDININVLCVQGGPLFILSSAGPDNSSYSLDSDQFHVVNYTEDPLGSCGPASIQNFTLTKVN